MITPLTKVGSRLRPYARPARSANRGARGKEGERGFSLILLSVCLVVMLGILGLAIDVGRMFIVKNELQTFADASAMAAVAQMDGTQSGIQLANSTATSGPLPGTPNAYNFATTAVSNVTTTYATSFTGTYDSYATASGSATNQYRFINVTATASVPFSFLPVINGIPTAMTVSANAIAGQRPQTTVLNGGLTPFGVDAHNSADKTFFGLTPGLQYTLKWGNGNTTTCGGDAGFNPNNAPDAHGFLDIGEGTGTSGIDQAIIYGGFPNALSTPSEVDANDSLYQDPGNRGSSIFSALATRSGQDTDQTSTTWAQYKASGTGNGRRVVTAPIDDPTTWSGSGSGAHVTVIGFGNFLLDPSSTISGSSGPICATYIGPANLNGSSSGGSDGTVVYTNVLYR